MREWNHPQTRFTPTRNGPAYHKLHCSRLSHMERWRVRIQQRRSDSQQQQLQGFSILESRTRVSTQKGLMGSQSRRKGERDKKVVMPILSSARRASVQFSSAAQSCPTLCNLMDCSTLGLPVHHQLPELTQTHVHRVGDAIQPSHPLSSPSPLAPESFPMSQLFT